MGEEGKEGTHATLAGPVFEDAHRGRATLAGPVFEDAHREYLAGEEQKNLSAATERQLQIAFMASSGYPDQAEAGGAAQEASRIFSKGP
uniref:Uncharacterized protein n=1 Tax=Oryza glumipatula TaxID=40148 RepID=A0A0D9YP98_9ORYZ